MKFGIEEEFFLIDYDDYSSGIHQRAFLKELSRSFKMNIISTNESDHYPTKINRDFENGYLSIKFDSTYNTLELAYPPFKDLNAFINLAEDVYGLIKEHAKDLTLDIKRVGYLDIPLTKESFLENESVLNTTNRKPSNSEIYDQFFHGKICATQVHLDIEIDLFFVLIKELYSLEIIYTRFYSNSQYQNFRNFRLNIIQNNHDENFKFAGFPSQLYKDKNSYFEGLNVWRDYSLIVPSLRNTCEFRSSCVQEDHYKLRSLIKTRTFLTKALLSGELNLDYIKNYNLKEVFLESLSLTPSRIVEDYLNEFLLHNKDVIPSDFFGD